MTANTEWNCIQKYPSPGCCCGVDLSQVQFAMSTNSNFGDKMRSLPVRSLPAAAGSLSTGIRRVPPRLQPTGRLAIVQSFTLFTDIPANDRYAITMAGRERRYLRGEVIQNEGADIREVILLTSGSVKMVQNSHNGSAVILRLCGPGELVGVSLQGTCRSTPQALQACTALIWDSRVFESLSTRFPSLRLNVSYILYKQLEDMEDRFREMSTECVAPRLGRQILRLVDQVGITSKGSVEISITREELAQLIGTSLFTVSRLLSQWDRSGIVTTRREGFSVDNLEALRELTQ